MTTITFRLLLFSLYLIYLGWHGMKWIVHLEGGPRRVNHGAVLLNGKIYSFGGYCSLGNYDEQSPIDVFVLDLGTLRWSPLPMPWSKEDPQYFQTPYQRYGHTAVGYNGRAYIWGGRNDCSGSCNTLYEYNPECSARQCVPAGSVHSAAYIHERNHHWTRIRTEGKMPPARDGHSACVIGDAMFVFGGYEQVFDRFSSEIYKLDFQTWTWTEMRPTGESPSARDFHTATAIGQKMYVFGGRSPDPELPEFAFVVESYDPVLRVYDTEKMEWSRPEVIGCAPCGRRSHSAVEYKGDLYIFGGYSGERRIHFNDMYKFNPVSCVWTAVKQGGELPVARRRQCCLVFNDSLIMFGGTSPRRRTRVPDPGDNEEFDLDSDLMDRADLHIFDFELSLKGLAMSQIMRLPNSRKLLSSLPWHLQKEIEAKTTPNPEYTPVTERSQFSHDG